MHYCMSDEYAFNYLYATIYHDTFEDAKKKKLKVKFLKNVTTDKNLRKKNGTKKRLEFENSKVWIEKNWLKFLNKKNTTMRLIFKILVSKYFFVGRTVSRYKFKNDK